METTTHEVVCTLWMSYSEHFVSTLTQRSRWLCTHLCLLAQCHPKGSNETGNLWFQTLYSHSRTATFHLRRSVSRETGQKEEGAREKDAHTVRACYQNLLSHFSPEDQGRMKFYSWFLRHKALCEKLIKFLQYHFEEVFALCCSFSQPFFISFSKSWLKNVFLTWIDESEIFFCSLNIRPDVSITPCVPQSLVSLLHERNWGKKTRNFVWIKEIILPTVNSEILKFCGRVWFELIFSHASERRFLSPCGGIEYCINGTHCEKHFLLPTLSIQREKRIKGKSGSCWISPVLITGWDTGITGGKNRNFKAC